MDYRTTLRLVETLPEPMRGVSRDLLSIEVRRQRALVLVEEAMEKLREAGGLLGLVDARQPNEVFERHVTTMEFSVRANTCLKCAHIVTIGALVRKTEAELLASKKFPRYPMNEIKEKLAARRLHLGMTDEEILAWGSPSEQR